jgi:hypothetical protein
MTETIGLKWLISRRVGGKYSPMTDLEKLYKIDKMPFNLFEKTKIELK